MLLSLKSDLPFVQVTIAYQGQAIEVENILLDTGSATTLLSADVVSALNIEPRPEDVLYFIRGVGGREAVFSRKLDYLRLGDRELVNFVIEVGGMDYGFPINGILGMDFLVSAGVIINLHQMSVEFA